MVRSRSIRTCVLTVVAAVAVLSVAAGRIARPAEQSRAPSQAGDPRKHRPQIFVLVSYHLKKSELPTAANEHGSSSTTLQQILNKNAVDVVGAIGNDEGEIFTFEPQPVDPDTLARITVRVTIEWMGETRLADLKFDAKSSGVLKSLLGDR